jgi:alpha-glucosidase (family GH31 glycosyl hydrolase)
MPRCDRVVASDVVATVKAAPLAIDLTFGGLPLTAARSPGHTGLSLCNGLSRNDFLTLDTCSDVDGGVALSYKTVDDRAASVFVGPSTQGAVQVRFSVADKREDEHLCLELQVTPDEAFFGLMERVVQGAQEESWQPDMTQGLNLRGQSVDLFIRPTVSVYSPFFQSTMGYGVYVQSTWPGTYRFGSEDPARVTIEYEGPEVTAHFFGDIEPLRVTERYARMVGTTWLPPRWQFGPMRWRNEVWDLPRFYDGTPYGGPYNSMIVEDILMMEALDIPCSMYLVDRPWAPGLFGYDNMEWDTDRLPEPVRMIQWLASRGIKTLLWIAPWVSGTVLVTQAQLRGYLIENEYLLDSEMPFVTRAIDLTNPEAVTWWQDKLIPRVQEGLGGFKLDRGDEKLPPGTGQWAGQYDDGRSYREAHNDMPRLYTEAAHGIFTRAGVTEFAEIPRTSWVGSARVATPWGGDSAPTEWGLRSVVVALQRNAAMNFPIWGTDTCGYNAQAPHEVCARWLAFSAFTPFMELGPTQNVAPWSRIPEGSDKVVDADGYHFTPVYDTELIAIWSFYANLQNDIADYLYAQAVVAHDVGTPIIRSMALAHPEDARWRDEFEQYYVGPDILVSPVWRSGQANVTVRVPPGAWLDAWTGLPVTGDSDVTVDTPIHKMPIFVRVGRGIDLGDLEARYAHALSVAAQVPDLATLAAGVQ